MEEKLHRVVGSLQRQNTRLELNTTDLCFLVTLRAAAERGVHTGLDEDALYDVFEGVCAVTEPAAPNPRKRATHAIQRLRDQRLLARVDGAGLVQAGEFAMTRLASAIVDFFFEDDALTRESLAQLTKTLLALLGAARQAARTARTEADWQEGVVGRLRTTVADLVAGIERRQRGLDAQQEEVRGQIAHLLQQDWFQAVQECEQLLEETSATLSELQAVLLEDTGHLLALLQEIGQLGQDAEVNEAETAAQQVEGQIDRVAAWGNARLAAWSEYFQFVQRYLRAVVRLDPDRAVSQRLREGLAAWPDRPFAFVVAEAPTPRLLRAVEPPVERPAVARPSADRDRPLVEAAPDRAPQDLEAMIDAALGAGAASLSAVLERVLPEVPAARRYRAIGRIAAHVAGRLPVAREHERQWVAVLDEAEVEEWKLVRKDGR